MASEIKLSDGIDGLLASFEPHIHHDQKVELSHASVLSIVLRLRLLAKIARAMEQEVSVFRLLETLRTTRINMDDLATDAFLRTARDFGSNVIPGNFGGKK